MTPKLGIAFVLSLLAIPISGVRAEDAPSKPMATIQGDTEGVHIDILDLKRSEGGMLTLHVALVNESGGPVKDSAFPGMNGSGWNVVLFDYQSKKKYGVITFDDGSCLCTTALVYNADFEPGRKVLWAKFRAPPESVQKITLLAGNGEPVEGIPITGAQAGQSASRGSVPDASANSSPVPKKSVPRHVNREEL
jgi:hypothetical protein